MLGRFFSCQARCGTEQQGTDLRDQIKTIQPLSTDISSDVDIYTSARSILRPELLCVGYDAGGVSSEGTCMPPRATSFITFGHYGYHLQKLLPLVQVDAIRPTLPDASPSSSCQILVLTYLVPAHLSGLPRVDGAWKHKHGISNVHGKNCTSE